MIATEYHTLSVFVCCVIPEDERTDPVLGARGQVILGAEDGESGVTALPLPLVDVLNDDLLLDGELLEAVVEVPP